jgi:hypothetical protein
MTDIIYRGRVYFFHWQRQTWYEPCKVVKRTKKYVVVESGNFPETGMYPGGTFHLNAEQLHQQGKAYHSRHGEHFYVQKPETGALFPSKELLATPDWTTLEAQAMGWDITIPPCEWNEWQKDCWMVASILKMPLREVVNHWKAGKLEELFAQVRSKSLGGLFPKEEDQ